jgi:hypothetical protein
MVALDLALRLLAVATAGTNQREKCALITGNRDISGLRSRSLGRRGRKSRNTLPKVAWGGPYGYDFARSRSLYQFNVLAAVKP